MTQYQSRRNNLIVDFPPHTLASHKICGAPICEVTPAPPAEPLALGGTPTVGDCFTEYSWTPTTTGGTGPYTYAGVELPGNWSVDPATGAIEHNDELNGPATITVEVTDANDNTAVHEFAITLSGACE